MKPSTTDLPGNSTEDPSKRRQSWITIANLLSFSRLAVAPLGLWFIVHEQWTIALALFVWSVISDLADGRIARSKGQTSARGGAIDHTCDAVLVTVLLTAIAYQQLLPVLLAPLVMMAFLQYAWDSKILSGHALRTSQLGRVNGINYYVIAGVVIFMQAVGMKWPPALWLWVGGWILILLTLVSMLDRAWHYYRIVGQKSTRKPK